MKCALRQAGKRLVGIEADRKVGGELVTQARFESSSPCPTNKLPNDKTDAALNPAFLRRGDKDPPGREAVLARGKHKLLGEISNGSNRRSYVGFRSNKLWRESPEFRCQSIKSGVHVPGLDQSVVESGEASVEDVMKHLLNARRLLRARVKAAAKPKHPYIAALNETDRRVEVFLDLAPKNLSNELVVGILRPETIRRSSFSETPALRLLRP